MPFCEGDERADDSCCELGEAAPSTGMYGPSLGTTAGEGLAIELHWSGPVGNE